MVRRTGYCAPGEGFTLLEMLVVLAVISGVAALALTFAKPSPDRLEPQRTAQDIAAYMRSARSAAVNRNRETEFTFDGQSRTYWTSGSAARRTVPGGMTVTMRSAKLDGRGTDIGRVRFFPDGSSTGASLELKTSEKTLKLTVDWLTGAIRIDAQDPKR